MGAYRSALARAIVADAMGAALAAGDYPALFVDAGMRDRVVEAVERALGSGAVLSSLKDAVMLPLWVDLTRYLLRPTLGEVEAGNNAYVATNQTINNYGVGAGPAPATQLGEYLRGLGGECNRLSLADLLKFYRV